LAFFSFVFLLAEFEVSCLKSKFFQNWISRGFLYTFLGVVAIEQRYAMIADGSIHDLETEKLPIFYFNVEWASFFIEISSWWMIGMGSVYFLLGICCMKVIRNRCREQYKNKWKRYMETHTSASPEPHVV